MHLFVILGLILQMKEPKMPLYYFYCEVCQKKIKRIFPRPCAIVICRDCGAEAKRSPATVSVQVRETLDNGIMSRRLDRLADAERIYNDHTNKK